MGAIYVMMSAVQHFTGNASFLFFIISISALIAGCLIVLLSGKAK